MFGFINFPGFINCVWVHKPIEFSDLAEKWGGGDTTQSIYIYIYIYIYMLN